MVRDGPFRCVHGGGGFAITHYAGLVVYDARGFLDKNRDSLSEQIVDVMASCKLDLVRSLFTVGDPSGPVRRSDKRASFNLMRLLSTRKPGKPTRDAGGMNSDSFSRPSKRIPRGGTESGTEAKSVGFQREVKTNPRNQQMTVSAQFKDSLTLLMSRLTQCQPHFVRCIKPNNIKAPHNFRKP